MFAVIFGLLILSTSGTFNFASSSSKNLVEEFQRTCKNYRYEVFIISKNFSVDELGKIEELTNAFSANRSVEIFFIYGNNSTVTLKNNFNEEINYTLNNDPTVNTLLKNNKHNHYSVNNITIVCPFNNKFNISQDKVFYSVLRLEKENEVYYC